MRFTKQQKEELFKQGLKQCPKCSEPKLLSEFGKDSSKIDGLKCYCKVHIKENNLKNKEQITKYKKEYYLENKEIVKEHYIKNKKKILKQRKKRYENNREKEIKRGKIYRLENKEKIAKKKTKRYKTDINFKITSNLRTRINSVLNGIDKSLNTMILIGCDINYLMYHLQCQFTKGMTWDNHGRGWNGKREWHIDHIKPCTSFDLSKPEEQLKCFNYTNLQPLWAEDNWKKGNR